jgi:hypothetical protein
VVGKPWSLATSRSAYARHITQVYVIEKEGLRRTNCYTYTIIDFYVNPSTLVGGCEA